MCGTRLAHTCPVCGTLNPPEFRFCGTCGTALGEGAAPVPALLQPPAALEPASATPPVTPLEGQRRIATVILADVQNSTDLMEQVGSEVWVEMMNQVLQLMETEIYRFGGQVDQFRGDGLVAFFGAATAHEDDPERAVLAGLSIQKAMQPFAQELLEQKNLEMKVRVGVNTGAVIVTSVGDRSQHREDTAMGEAIAIAARMETAAQPGTVLVSENTYRLVETAFKWQALGKIRVKGVSQPIAVYQPLDPQQNARESTDTQIFQAPPILSGRTLEFEVLKQSIQDLQRGHGQIVLVTGDKGIGKSFLLNQVRQYFVSQGVLINEALGDESAPLAEFEEEATLKKVIWLRGTCRSYQQSWPYSMWQDMLLRWLGMEPDETGDKILARLQHQAELLWGNDYQQQYPYLAALLSLPLETSIQARLNQMNAQDLQQQVFQAVCSWIETLAKRSPLIVTFLDMQWVDTSSLELLDYCLPLTDNEALVWLAVFRPDRTSPVWEFRHHVETEYPHRLTAIDLPPLSLTESGELIDQIIGPEALTPETRALVIEKSEGNPYYLQEILLGLIHQKVLVKEEETGSWQAVRAISSLDLPSSLQSLLLARIDRLSSGQRRVLQIAAVIGSVFWQKLLEALLNEDDNHLKEDLIGLQREQLVQERRRIPSLGMEYLFISPLLREVAYESLLSSQQVAYHLKIAEWIEASIGPEDRKPYEALIAYHYRRAGVRDKELYYTLRAGQQALSVYANVEAITHFTRTLELLDEMETETRDPIRLHDLYSRRFEALEGRAKAYYPSGNLEAGNADAVKLLSLADKLPDEPNWHIDALLANPYVQNIESQEDLDKGLPMAEEALALSQKIGDRRREMFSLIALANLRFMKRKPNSLELADQALTIARQLGDLRSEVDLLLGIGSAFGLDDLEQSSHYLEAALSISKKQDDKNTELRLLSAISPQFERTGDYYRQLVDYEQKRLKLAREVGNRLTEGHALMFCGQIQALYLGDYASGLELVQQALQLWEKTTSRLFPLLRVAQIQTMLGKFDEAQATIEIAKPVSEHFVDVLGQVGLGLVMAILYNQMGDEAHLKAALDSLNQVIRMAAENQVSRQYHMVAACESTAAHLALGGFLPGGQGAASDPKERKEHLRLALDSSQTALEIYEKFGFTQVMECVSEEILFRRSLALEANQQLDKAQEFLKWAFNEMMRKHALIPPESPYHKSYLENIKLHREIMERYSNR